MSMTVWEWFEQRSYHHQAFEAFERSSGNGVERPSTTLIFPARNVAGTIGTILDVVEGLRARTGLPGQVIVIDADSPDGTADVARAHGAEVYSENELMRDYGPAQGKGDAMWRALSLARGDIVMFADSDSDDFQEHFVYGTLGPLLADPELQFVKGAFRRPFKQGEEKILDGGGRVTELMAKPLINLFYPELAGFTQPLAGEFAARREVLSKVPFFTGYGVEIGMLIDVFEQVGLPGMAQVDLGTRQNRHQSLASLSRMSSVVLRTVAAREGLGQRLGGELDQTVPTLWEIHSPDTYLHAVATEDGLRLDEHLNELVERPPLASLADGAGLTATALPSRRRPRPPPADKPLYPPGRLRAGLIAVTAIAAGPSGTGFLPPGKIRYRSLCRRLSDLGFDHIVVGAGSAGTTTRRSVSRTGSWELWNSPEDWADNTGPQRHSLKTS